MSITTSICVKIQSKLQLKFLKRTQLYARLYQSENTTCSTVLP